MGIYVVLAMRNLWRAKLMDEETKYISTACERYIYKTLQGRKGKLKKVKFSKFNHWGEFNDGWHLIAEKFAYLPYLHKSQRRVHYPEYMIYTSRCGRRILSERDYYARIQKDAPFDMRVLPPKGQLTKWHPEGVCQHCYYKWQRENAIKFLVEKKRAQAKHMAAQRKRRKELEE